MYRFVSSALTATNAPHKPLSGAICIVLALLACGRVDVTVTAYHGGAIRVTGCSINIPSITRLGTSAHEAVAAAGWLAGTT
jgi:hypothetical protein